MRNSLTIGKQLGIALSVLAAFFVFSTHGLGLEVPPPETPVPSFGPLTVMGSAKIYKGNIAGAKGRAVADALDAAARRAFVDVLTPEGTASAFQALLAAITGKGADFANTFEVLAEAEFDDHYHVLLSVTAAQEKITGLAGTFRGMTGTVVSSDLPKILFLMAEQNLRDISPNFWWGEGTEPSDAHAESAMAAMSSQAGFPVIDHGTDVPDVPVEAAIILQPDLNDREALDIGKAMAADIVIAGKAIVYKVPETMEGETPSFNATLTARALAVESGETLTSVLETVVKTALDEDQGSTAALTEAGDAAAEKLVQAIQSQWEAKTEAEQTVEIAVFGASNLGDFVKFRKALASVPGVEDLRLRRMDGNDALITVIYPDGAQSLSGMIERFNFDRFVVEIDKVAAGTLRLSLMPR